MAGEDDGVPARSAGEVEDPAAALRRVGAEEAEYELRLPLGLEVVAFGIEGEVLLAEPARVPGVSVRLGFQAKMMIRGRPRAGLCGLQKPQSASASMSVARLGCFTSSS